MTKLKDAVKWLNRIFCPPLKLKSTSFVYLKRKSAVKCMTASFIPLYFPPKISISFRFPPST
ncbi:hypothetical protein HanRHA438_Chr01g0043741 [Helianthus annuus]|nr:hypothetical protein HanRHA438_Chr01g0043741 [Helianthus annuus]